MEDDEYKDEYFIVPEVIENVIMSPVSESSKTSSSSPSTTTKTVNHEKDVDDPG